MKIKLELNLENRAWSMTELIFALGETLHILETADGKNGANAPWTGFGPINDRAGNKIGTYRVE